MAYAFWARIERLRTQHGMSLIELGHTAGVRRQTYSALRQTTRRPRRDIVLALAAAVGLPADEALQLSGYSPVDLDTVRATILATDDLDGERKAALLALLDVYEAEDRAHGRTTRTSRNRRRRGLAIA